MAGQRSPGGGIKKKGEVSIREGAEMESSAPPEPGAPEATTAAEHGEVDPASAWLFEQIERGGALPSGVTAREAAGAVLCTLSRQVSEIGARELVHSLPQTLRGVTQPCALHRDEQVELFGREEFLDTVARHLSIESGEAAAVSRAVFAVIKGQMSREEASDIEGQLPEDLREIWSPRKAA